MSGSAAAPQCIVCGSREHRPNECPRKEERGSSLLVIPRPKPAFPSLGRGRPEPGLGRGRAESAVGRGRQPPVSSSAEGQTYRPRHEERQELWERAEDPGYLPRALRQPHPPQGPPGQRQARPGYNFAADRSQPLGMSRGYEELGRRSEPLPDVPLFCSVCYQRGHAAGSAECPVPQGRAPQSFRRTADHSQPNGGLAKPRQTYVPPDRSEEELIQQGTVQVGEMFEDEMRLEVAMTGEAVPAVPDLELFDELPDLHPQLQENLKVTERYALMPVQLHAYFAVRAGRDVMACSRTGSGKTLAFLLPIAQSFLKDSSVQMTSSKLPRCPKAIVLAPTHELASQVFCEAKKLLRNTRLVAHAMYGGTSIHYCVDQVRELEAIHVLIATPGRLRHMIEEGVIGLEEVKFFVLDEADRMVHENFIHDVANLCKDPRMPEAGPEGRQTLAFSATFPRPLQQLASEFMHRLGSSLASPSSLRGKTLARHLFLSVGLVGAPNGNVTQEILPVDSFSEKKPKLLAWLKTHFEELSSGVEPLPKLLIFVERKRSADFLGSVLNDSGFDALTLHGLRSQSQREEALGLFNNDEVRILVATACGERGLDIKGVAIVLNYDLPQDIHGYVHRIGRTGRCGNAGRAVSYFDRSLDADMAPQLLRSLELGKQEPPEFLVGIAQAIARRFPFGKPF